MPVYIGDTKFPFIDYLPRSCARQCRSPDEERILCTYVERSNYLRFFFTLFFVMLGRGGRQGPFIFVFDSLRHLSRRQSYNLALSAGHAYTLGAAGHTDRRDLGLLITLIPENPANPYNSRPKEASFRPLGPLSTSRYLLLVILKPMVVRQPLSYMEGFHCCCDAV